MKPITSIRSRPLKAVAPIILVASIGTQLTLAQTTVPESAEESLQELGIESDFVEITIIDLNDESSTSNVTSQISTSPQIPSPSSQQEALDIIGAEASLTTIKSVDTLRNSEIQDSPSKILSQESNRYRVPSEFLNNSEAVPSADLPASSGLEDVPFEFDPPEIDLIMDPESLGGELTLANASQLDKPPASTSLSEELSQSISEELTESQAASTDPSATPPPNEAHEEDIFTDDESDLTVQQSPDNSAEERFYEENDSEVAALAPESISESLAENNTTFQPSSSSFLSLSSNQPSANFNSFSALSFNLIEFSSSESNVPEPATGLLLSLSILGALCHRKR